MPECFFFRPVRNGDLLQDGVVQVIVKEDHCVLLLKLCASDLKLLRITVVYFRHYSRANLGRRAKVSFCWERLASDDMDEELLIWWKGARKSSENGHFRLITLNSSSLHFLRFSHPYVQGVNDDNFCQHSTLHVKDRKASYPDSNSSWQVCTLQ